MRPENLCSGTTTGQLENQLVGARGGKGSRRQLGSQGKGRELSSKVGDADRGRTPLREK